MPKIQTYVSGNPKVIETGTFANVAEIVLDDGRTAQMYFTDDGELSIRAWGNIPAKLGNGNKTSFRSMVDFETLKLSIVISVGDIDEIRIFE